MPRAKFALDVGDLLAAARDSCCPDPAFLGDLLERPPVAIEPGFLAGKRLPALDHYINVFRIDFDAAADALSEFGGGQRRAAAQEWLVHQLAALQVIEDRAPENIDGFLRRMIEFLLVRTAHDELGRWRIPDRGVLTGFTEPGRVLLPDVPAGLVLIPVVGACEDRAAFVPDDLLRVQEANSQESVEHFAGEYGGVPYVSDLNTRYEFKRLGPVGASITGDGRFGVALRAVLHVARLSRSTAVKAGAVTPLGVELDAVRRGGHRSEESRGR